ncbi:transposase [Micromonospora sp. NPDC005299]|uniref:IS110 family transposase n=1 Tax=Micromonospora sp. NPDC005299 TaxID=3364231 RepID=UPI00368B4E6A
MNEDLAVTVGVDSHKDVHVAAVLDQAGRLLGTRSFPTTIRGYAQLATSAESFGTVLAVGMEGTGSHGPGLLRFLGEYGLPVVEVDRPDRSTAVSARPTPSTLRLPPEPCSPAAPAAPRRPATLRSR